MPGAEQPHPACQVVDLRHDHLDRFAFAEYVPDAFHPVRRNAADVEETIAYAFILREASFDDDLLALMDEVYPEDPILLFGDGELSGVSNVAAKLQQRGYENISILRVGVQGWQKAGGPVSEPTILEVWDESGETQ